MNTDVLRVFDLSVTHKITHFLFCAGFFGAFFFYDLIDKREDFGGGFVVCNAVQLIAQALHRCAAFRF